MKFLSGKSKDYHRYRANISRDLPLLSHICQKVSRLDKLITYILPACYAIFLLWIIGKNQVIRMAGVNPMAIRIFSGAKILTGIFYTYLMIRYIPSAKADIDLFFGDGLMMYKRFWQDPAGFPAYLSEVFTITDFRLGRTDSDFIRTVFDGIKFIHFLLNFFSGGHLYTNVLLFNGLAAWLFLRSWAYMKNMFGQPWLGNWIFLFPSAFFFTSVILKEGIELCLIAAILPELYLFGKKPGIFRLAGIVLLMGLMFFFKYLIAATFLMMLLLFIVFRKYPSRTMWISGLFLLALGVIFFCAGYVFPALNFPDFIIQRRLEFLQLEANTELHMRELLPTPFSFLQALPEALYNVILRPVPAEVDKPFYYFFTLELYGLWLIVLFGIFGKKTGGVQSKRPEALALLIFSVINLLIIGYTITNTGAIIRYRSIFLPGLGYFFWKRLQATLPGRTIIRVIRNTATRIVSGKWS